MSLNSRRQFIKATTLGGIATTCFPFQTVLAGDMNKKKWLAPKGMRILFQGDSITDGNRGRNTDPNHIMGHGYAFSIASRLGADYPEQAYDFFNRGISGNKVIDLKERWQTDTIDLKPDVLSILVGVNDASSVVFNWEPVVSVAKFEETYRFLLEQTLEKIPGIRLVLCEPFIKAVGRVKDNWDAYYSDIIKRQEIVRISCCRIRYPYLLPFRKFLIKPATALRQIIGFGMVCTQQLPDMNSWHVNGLMKSHKR